LIVFVWKEFGVEEYKGEGLVVVVCEDCVVVILEITKFDLRRRGLGRIL